MYQPSAVRPSSRAAPSPEPAAPAPRAAIASARLEPLESRRLLSTTVLFTENFEGSSLAYPWVNRVDPGANAATRWGLNTAKAYSGAQSAFCSATSGAAGLKRNVYDNDQANSL